MYALSSLKSKRYKYFLLFLLIIRKAIVQLTHSSSSNWVKTSLNSNKIQASLCFAEFQVLKDPSVFQVMLFQFDISFPLRLLSVRWCYVFCLLPPMNHLLKV